LKLWGLSQVETYDGRFYMRRSNARMDPQFTTDDNLYILEFIYKTTQLIDDFKADKKDIRQIRLAVMWTDDLDPNDSTYRLLDVPTSTIGADGRNFPQTNMVLRNIRDADQVEVLYLDKFIEDITANTE